MSSGFLNRVSAVIRAALERAVRYALQLSDADPVARRLIDHWECANHLLILLEDWTKRAMRECDALHTCAFLHPRLHLPEWREPLALLTGGLPDDAP